MRVLLFFCVILIGVRVNDLEAAQSGKKSQVIAAYLGVLRESDPEVAAAFDKVFSGRFNGQDIDAVLLAVRQMRSGVDKDLGSVAEKRKLEDGHRAAWKIALCSFGKAQTPEAKHEILNEWNISLSERGPHIASQICALPDEWQREMLTDRFWNLVDSDSNLSILKSVCYALFEKGNENDGIRLQEQARRLKTSEAKQVVQNTLNWMEFKALAKSDTPGPASAPPSLAYAANDQNSVLEQREEVELGPPMQTRERRTSRGQKREKAEGYRNSSEGKALK